MAVRYLIEQRVDGWHVANRAGGDDHLFPTREAAITWVAHFGAQMPHSEERSAEVEPYLPAEDAPAMADADADEADPDVQPYLPPEQARPDGPASDDLPAAGADPRPAGGGPSE